MSVEAVAWAFAQEVTPAGRKFVLVALANHADAEGRCFPSQKRLAFMTGQSVRAVRDHLAALEEAGLITRVETRRESDGGRTSDTIFLNAPPDVLDPSRGADDGGDPDRVPVKRPRPIPPAESAGAPRQNLPTPPAESAGAPRQNLPGKKHQLETSEESGGGALEPRAGDRPPGHHPETEGILKRTFGRLYDQLLLEEPRRARWADLSPDRLAEIALEVRRQPSVQAFSTRLKDKLDELVGVHKAPARGAAGAAAGAPTPSEAKARLERQAAATRASEEAYDRAIAAGATPEEADRAAAAAYDRALKGDLQPA